MGRGSAQKQKGRTGTAEIGNSAFVRSLTPFVIGKEHER